MGNGKDNKNNKSILHYLSLITQLGVSSVVPIILGVMLGQFIDQKIGSKGVFSIIFIIIGAAAAINNIFRLGMPKENDDLDDEENNDIE